jgi:hypothetical protein
MAFPTELSELRLEVYWDALKDLGIDGIMAACEDLARNWVPGYKVYFPVPATIREYVNTYRKEQQQLKSQQARALLPAETPVPPEEALANVRSIIEMLDAKMDMQAALKESEAARRAQRKADLLAQVKQIRNGDTTHEEPHSAD